MNDDARPVVVKVGGSLFDLPDLGPRLNAWLKQSQFSRVILVPGGGRLVDVVRDWDGCHKLGEESANVLALSALSVTGLLLVRLVERGLIVRTVEEAETGWQTNRVPVLNALGFDWADRTQPGHLPYRWDVTSDSIALRLAVVARARQLVLLKSVTIAPEMDWSEAARQGWVDAYFPTQLADAAGIEITSVNFREWPPGP